MVYRPESAASAELIHGALCGASSWQDFLEQTRLLVPNGQAVLVYHDAAAGIGAAPLSAGIDTGMLASYGEYYATVNPWMSHAAVRPVGRVVQADRMLPRDKLVSTEFYNEFLNPQDIQTGFGVTIRRDGGCNFHFSVLCADIEEADADAVRAILQDLVPHLGHAFDYYRRQRRLAGLGEWTERPQLAKARGVIQLGAGTRVLFADDEAQRLADCSGCLSIGPFGRFACTSAALTEFVQGQVAMWNNGTASPSARTFHLPRQGGALPLRITAVRPGGTGEAFFRGPECILLLEDPAEAVDGAAEAFGAIHGLSGAEQRVVASLAKGMSPDEIAPQFGVSVHTVRTQLKHIFAKTGLNRQTDLVRHVCIMAGAG